MAKLSPTDLPHNIEAEQSVLGTILSNDRVMDEVADRLRPEDFFRPQHAALYRAMLELYRSDGRCEAVSVVDYLTKKGLLDKVGGSAYLVELLGKASAPDLIPTYARMVKEKSMLRRIIQAAGSIMEKCYSGADGNFEELINEVERAFFEATQEGTEKTYYPVSDVLEDVFRRLGTLKGKKGSIVTGIPSGFADLDRLTSGFHKADFVVVAGRPAMGKTAFVMNLCQNIAVNDRIPCAFFSLEMSREQIVTRMLSNEAGINSQRIRSGDLTDDEFERLTMAAEKLSSAPIYIDDTPSLSPFELRARARRLKRECNIGLIAVDYLQLMRLKERRDTREQEISEISRSLKAIAKELDIPVVAISQLNRGVESRPDKRPQLADLRESGAIEQDADLILFIYRREFYFPDDEEYRGIAEIIVGKQRNGPSGESVKLRFYPEHTAFRNL